MDELIDVALSNCREELHRKSTVYAVVQELVGKVERHALLNSARRMEENYLCTQRLNDSLLEYIKQLEQKTSRLSTELATVKSNASLVRDGFVAEIGYFLSESKVNKKIRDRIAVLESRLSNLSAFGGEEEDSRAEDAAVVSPAAPAPSLAPEPAAPPETAAKEAGKGVGGIDKRQIICHLVDESVLEVFTYLSTADVLNTVGVSKAFYKRMVGVFGTDSAIVRQWRAEDDQQQQLQQQLQPQQQLQLLQVKAPAAPVATPAEVPAAAPPSSSFGIPPSVTESLSKKLNSAELKVVLDMADRIKKQAAANEAQAVQAEDAAARLQSTESIRDFLIDKLKSAEKALKGLLAENSLLKRQGASDQEIISYLDLQAKETDSQLADLTHRCHHLQAALDLQLGTHSHREEVLLADLSDCKDKYDKLEATAKAQKKRLAKEVKELRAKLEALQQDKTVQDSRMQMLREALGR